MTRGRRWRAAISTFTDADPKPSARAQEEINALRAREAKSAAYAAMTQWRENRLFAAYGRQIDIDPNAAAGTWKTLDPDLGWRRGREGMLPSKLNMSQKFWVEVRIAGDVADALILRDLGERPPEARVQ